jgi:hypothetical protein
MVVRDVWAKARLRWHDHIKNGAPPLLQRMPDKYVPDCIAIGAARNETWGTAPFEFTLQPPSRWLQSSIPHPA